MRTGILGQFRLVLGADGTDDRRAEMVGPLTRNEADAARSGVHQNDGALADLEGAVEQILHGHALEHHRRCLFVADVVRQLHRAVGGQQTLRRIAAERRHVGDAVAHLDVGHVGTYGGNGSGALIAGDERHADGGRIHAHAEIGVDEIDAAGVLLELDLARARRADLDILEGQNFRTAGFVYAHCCDHVSPL